MPKDSEPVSSLAQLAQRQLLKDFEDTLSSESAKATFACGGQVPINLEEHSEYRKDDGIAGNMTQRSSTEGGNTPSSATASNLHGHQDNLPLVSPPVTVRFEGSRSALGLPGGQNSPLFGELLKSTQPATFGLQGQDVYDESYRKAVKLDPAMFCTNFCPYSLGIIDVINQLLLPSVEADRGVRAELYKLNVYSSPSGHFKAHVDTPRAEDQVGSLVVALPSNFEGGGLVVRHSGQTIKFDWSTSPETTPMIQWAAFYSDCEHEVEQVTSGHRVTLTYNLYASRRPGLLAGDSIKSLDGTKLPLYKSLSLLLACPSFMDGGGKLGIFFSHVYPHTHRSAHGYLPSMLKGVDMALFEAVKAAKLDAKLITHLDLDRDDLETMQEYPSEKYPSDTGGDEERTLTDVYFTGTRAWFETLDHDYELFFNVRDHFDDTEVSFNDIQWLNKGAKNNKEISTSYMAYGNEAENAFVYSRIALLIQVPSFSERHFE